MWTRAWLAFCVTSTALCQQTYTRVQQDGATFEWGWQLTHPDNVGLGSGQYVVDKENPVQRSSQVSNTTHQRKESHLMQANTDHPLQLYLLQQQPSSSIEQQIFPTQPSNIIHYSSVPNYDILNNYNTSIQYTIHHIQNNNEPRSNDKTQRSVIPHSEEAGAEYNHDNVPSTSIVRVFKDHNCSNEQTVEVNEAKRGKEYPEIPTYNIHDINEEFSAQGTERPLTYRSAIHFNVESPRQNARSERYYYNTQVTTTISPEIARQVEDQFSKLVAYTQDLISNEDLLSINHAAEKQVPPQNDDIIKPRARFSLKTDQTRHDYYVRPTTTRSIVTVKSKIGNIVDTEIEHIYSNDANEKILRANPNEYTFSSPIVVPDSPYTEYNKQFVNNFVSTMAPYIENGYEVIDVRDALEDNKTNNLNSDVSQVNVTPRPIGPKYLAPITVALRLLNANDTDILNDVEDHEGADSEFIADTVERPKADKTVVEIQPSIPLEITHINDVETHEYLEEGRSNNKDPLDIAKKIYNQYIANLKPSKQIKKNFSQILSQDTQNAPERYVNNKDNAFLRDNIETSENIQTEVEIRPNDDNINSQRTEFVRDYYDYDPETKNVVQPIIIEKEIPITKFVDRFIEKHVPYPEPVEVIKEIPIDRPVGVPIPYEKIVEKPIEVTKYIDKPYPVEVSRPYPVEVKIPYPVEHKVYVDRPVHVPYPVEKLVEKQIIHQIPVPTPVAVPFEVKVPVEHRVFYPVPIETPVPVRVEVEKPVPVEKVIHKEIPVPYPVEKKIPYPVAYETKVPVPYGVEKRIPVPVEKIVEKPVTVTKLIEKPIRVEVPVPRPVPVAVHVPQPYPVDRIIEKKIPYPVQVERIVERKIPVKVPYPVEKIVERIVEKPVIVTKYVNKPYTVEKRVPYPVEKIVEKKVPYPVKVPVEVKVPYPVEKIVEKPIHVHVKAPYENENIQRHNPYSFVYTQSGQQSVNVPQYQKYTPEQQKSLYLNNINQNYQSQQLEGQYATQFYQYPNDKHQRSQINQQQPIETTHWGNLYVSSYQDNNNTLDNKTKFRTNPLLHNYINYLTKGHSFPYQYYGPVPPQGTNDWEQNLLEQKVRRTDRTPRVANLKIEYGGFRPPLIPSTEVDLDGIPVNNKGETS